MTTLTFVCGNTVQGEDAGRVSQAMAEASHAEYHLLGKTADEFLAQIMSGFAAYVLDEKGRLIAFLGLARIPNLGTSWMEIGGAYVRPDMRRYGLMTVLWGMLLARHSGRDILTITTSPYVKRIALKYGMVPCARKSFSALLWQESCKVCTPDKMGGDGMDRCPLAAFENQCRADNACVFLVSAETARRRNMHCARFTLPDAP